MDGLKHKIKNKGLKHRFDKNETFEWLFWLRCLWCGDNRWDALHHIISPSSFGYHGGECNKSILNSCPIHNQSCHLDNGELHKEENEIELLQRVITIMSNNNYVLKNIDKEFIKTYFDTHYQYIKMPKTYESLHRD